MTRTDERVGPDRRWLWALGILLLLGALAAVWSCAERNEPAPIKTTLDRPDVIRTTIRITKGRPGSSSLWDVTVETGNNTSSQQFKERGVIPAEIWKRMNGNIGSFTEIDCDGTSTVSVTGLRYKTQVDNAEPREVSLKGEIGRSPDWNLPDCADLSKDCTLPAYYFHPVVDDGANCAQLGQNVVWKMVLN